MTLTQHASNLAPDPEGETAGLAAPPLAITALPNGVGGVRLAPQGELDMSTVPLLRAALLREVVAGRREVVLDLSGVTFLDARGIDLLVEAHRRCAGRGIRFRLGSVSARQRRLLTMARVSRLIPRDAS